MILYRYFNLTHGLEALQTGVWKIGRIDKLNDIFDCRPRLKNLPSGMATIIEDNYLKQFGGVLGLLCYSSTINDPVIWSHYANVHQGLALGFEFAEADMDFPHLVQYSKDRPTLDFTKIGTFPEDRNPDTARKKLIESGFTTKHPSWTYEQEYRQFVPLDLCRMKGEHYFRSIQWDRLKDIVLGARCPVSMQDIDRIVSDHHADELVNRQIINLPRPQIRQCQVNELSYDLAFDSFSRSP